MTETISRRATRRIAAIKAKNLTCRSHTRRNDFVGRDCDPAFAWQALDDFGSGLTVRQDGRFIIYTVQKRSGDWFVLTEDTHA